MTSGMPCVGTRLHRWSVTCRCWGDCRHGECQRCGMDRWQFVAWRDEDRWWRSDAAWDAYRAEMRLRDRAIDEQRHVMARLRADEEEALSLYGRKSTYLSRLIFERRTPAQVKEDYPSWQRARTARQETARQRRKLREGQETLAAIRRYLQSPGRSPLPASRPAKTSRT